MYADSTNDNLYIYSNGAWIPTGSSNGIFGISDSSGVYTFYATIALANAAAVSGDTIELFADVEETGAVEFIMKDGVTYNLNGHTYTLNVATTENTITDNNVAITSTLMNGRFIRTGGTAGTGDSMTIHIDNASSSIICEGVIFESDFGVVVTADGGIEGATFKNTVYTSYMARNLTGSGYFKNCSFESAAGAGPLVYGSLINCIVEANGNLAVGSVGATINGCVISSTAGAGLNMQGTSIVQNCVISSSSNYGVQTATGGCRMTNSSVISTANFGLYGLHDLQVENCTIYSSTNNGAYVGGLTRLENSVIKSTADAAVRLGGGYMGGCNVYSSFNSVNGHAVECTTGSTVFNNILEVANTSANNIKNEGVTPTVTYGQNTYKGAATTPVEATIVQGQTNTHDTYGNIDIG
jgi:hypothetical protein